MNNKDKFFWSAYIFTLIGTLWVFDSVLLVEITSTGEAVIATFFLLLVGFFFKKWFDGFYKGQ